jgi:hypothetical protein
MVSWKTRPQDDGWPEIAVLIYPSWFSSFFSPKGGLIKDRTGIIIFLSMSILFNDGHLNNQNASSSSFAHRNRDIRSWSAPRAFHSFDRTTVYRLEGCFVDISVISGHLGRFVKQEITSWSGTCSSKREWSRNYFRADKSSSSIGNSRSYLRRIYLDIQFIATRSLNFPQLRI